ncbi:hypothetical protein E8E14_008640 [Neopestalotiopsis sp. 37M]|nr:hypothetical protein E8E14_008640 [Neopestalotiopsis sp. 37M]
MIINAHGGLISPEHVAAFNQFVGRHLRASDMHPAEYDIKHFRRSMFMEFWETYKTQRQLQVESPYISSRENSLQDRRWHVWETRWFDFYHERPFTDMLEDLLAQDTSTDDESDGEQNCQSIAYNNLAEEMNSLLVKIDKQGREGATQWAEDVLQKAGFQSSDFTSYLPGESSFVTAKWTALKVLMAYFNDSESPKDQQSATWNHIIARESEAFHSLFTTGKIPETIMEKGLHRLFEKIDGLLEVIIILLAIPNKPDDVGRPHSAYESSNWNDLSDGQKQLNVSETNTSSRSSSVTLTDVSDDWTEKSDQAKNMGEDSVQKPAQLDGSGIVAEELPEGPSQFDGPLMMKEVSLEAAQELGKHRIASEETAERCEQTDESGEVFAESNQRFELLDKHATLIQESPKGSEKLKEYANVAEESGQQLEQPNHSKLSDESPLQESRQHDLSDTVVEEPIGWPEYLELASKIPKEPLGETRQRDTSFDATERQPREIGDSDQNEVMTEHHPRIQSSSSCEDHKYGAPTKDPVEIFELTFEAEAAHAPGDRHFAVHDRDYQAGAAAHRPKISEISSDVSPIVSNPTDNSLFIITEEEGEEEEEEEEEEERQ